MYRTMIKLMSPLLAATFLVSCGHQGDQTTASTSDPDKCVDGNAMNVGDTNVTLTLAGTEYRWDTSGNVVTLTTTGNGKDVELVQSTSVGGPSLLPGDCLRSGGYIRLASTGDHPNGRFLQALAKDGVDPGAHPSPNVTIGNYPDPNNDATAPQQIDAIFNVVKVAGSRGKIIRKGDTVIIRGVSHDPWLQALNPTDGMAIALIDWSQYAQASKWVISKGTAPKGR